MTNNDDVFFDDKSGISIEEQKEILSAINGIAEKNRRRLSQGNTGETEAQKGGSKMQINARKSGAFFPLVVNISAVVILCAGALFLVSFSGKMDSQLRTGDAVYSVTEKALIDEIRKDTAEKIAAKDLEMAMIASRLEEVDAQLARFAGSREMTLEQLQAQSRLMALHNTYSDELSVLQDERSRILESSRSKETVLRIQFEEGANDQSAARTSAELDSAMRELEKLSGEQEKISALDAQVAGALSSVSVLIQNGQNDQASAAVAQLRSYLDNNSLSSARSFQARKDFYYQSINLAETMIEINRAGSTQNASGLSDQSGILAENAQHLQTIAELQKSIDALSSGSSGQASRVTELEGNVSSLRASVSTLETEKASLNRTIQQQEQELENLKNVMNTMLQMLSDN